VGEPGSALRAGLAGAAIGGMIGNRIGASMDEEDKRLAYGAQMQALEGGRSGTAVPWRNPDVRPLRIGGSRTALSSQWIAVPTVPPTRSTSTARRKLRAAAPVGTRTAPGRAVS